MSFDPNSSWLAVCNSVENDAPSFRCPSMPTNRIIIVRRQRVTYRFIRRHHHRDGVQSMSNVPEK